MHLTLTYNVSIYHLSICLPVHLENNWDCLARTLGVHMADHWNGRPLHYSLSVLNLHVWVLSVVILWWLIPFVLGWLQVFSKQQYLWHCTNLIKLSIPVVDTQPLLISHCRALTCGKLIPLRLYTYLALSMCPTRHCGSIYPKMPKLPLALAKISAWNFDCRTQPPSPSSPTANISQRDKP